MIYIQLHEVLLDVSYFPRLYEYIKKHGHYVAKTFPDTWYVDDDGAQNFIASASTILEKGFVVTIDWVFSQWSTGGPNFIELAHMGKQFGFDNIFYGKEYMLHKNAFMLDKENNIVMQAFDIDTDVLTPQKRNYPSASKQLYTDSYNPRQRNAKICIQKTANTKSSFTIIANQEPL